MAVTVRVLTEDDVPALPRLLVAGREFLAPWEPERAGEYSTEEVQRAGARRTLERYEQGAVLPGVVLADGEPVGRVDVDDVVRGPFLSGDLGCWVSEHVNGRGVATAAVAAMVRLASGEAGLHRLQAGTLVRDSASQRVLRRNGSERIGFAPRYLRIAGRWQDHLLVQRFDEPAH